MEMEIALTGGKKVEASFKGFTVQTDQPVKVQGDNSAPPPFDLFLASIGTCAGYYVLIFCQKRDLPTDDIKVLLKTEGEKRVDKIKIEVILPASFPEKYKEAVIKSANSCTVKKHILEPPEFEIVAVTQ